jgi:hypothetical protein
MERATAALLSIRAAFHVFARRGQGGSQERDPPTPNEARCGASMSKAARRHEVLEQKVRGICGGRGGCRLRGGVREQHEGRRGREQRELEHEVLEQQHEREHEQRELLRERRVERVDERHHLEH